MAVWDDEDLFDDVIFGEDGEGAIRLGWEVASRCVEPRPDSSPCFSEDTRQPYWSCTACGGLGSVYTPRQEVRGLFRDQSKWQAHRSSGEHMLGEARVTLPFDVKPAYVDERVRDRFVVLEAVGTTEAGTIFYPAARPVPFIFDGVPRAWRVQLQSLDPTTRTRPQP